MKKEQSWIADRKSANDWLKATGPELPRPFALILNGETLATSADEKSLEELRRGLSLTANDAKVVRRA